MTITGHAPHSSNVDITHLQPMAAPVPAPDTGANLEPPPRRSWLLWFARSRHYHHPQRERFVEEAAMSREMFRL